MLKRITDIAIDKIWPYLLINNRWILVSTLFVIAPLPKLVKEVHSYTNLRTALSDPLFWVPSLVVLLAGLSLFFFLRWRKPPKDHFIVVLAKFLPVALGDKDAADRFTHRVREEIRPSLDPTAKLVSINTEVDPYSPTSRKIAITQARNHRANVVICGVLREESEELFIEPALLIIDDKPYKSWFPTSLRGPGDTSSSQGQRITFKKTRSTETRDLVIKVSAVAHMYYGRYGDAIAAFFKANDHTVGPTILLGIACLKESRFKEAFLNFDAIVKSKPNSFDGWALRAYAARKIDDEAAWKESIVRLGQLTNSEQKIFFPDSLVRETVTRMTAEMALEQVERTKKALELVNENIQAGHEAMRRNSEKLSAFSEGCQFRDEAHAAFSQEDFKQAAIKFLLAHEAFARLPADDPNRAKYDTSALAMRALALSKLGRKDEATRTLSHLRAVEKSSDSLIVARAFASVSDKQKSLQWLKRAIDEDSTASLRARNYPEFELFAGDERFLTLIEGKR